MRRRRARAGDRWHLDQVQLKIKGKRHWLWRAVDRDGLVLDILVQERRNQQAAERFLRRVLEGEGTAPRVVVTDKLASYPPARRRVLPAAEHRRHNGLNNRAENSRVAQGGTGAGSLWGRSGRTGLRAPSSRYSAGRVTPIPTPRRLGQPRRPGA